MRTLQYILSVLLEHNILIWERDGHEGNGCYRVPGIDPFYLEDETFEIMERRLSGTNKRKHQ